MSNSIAKKSTKSFSFNWALTAILIVMFGFIYLRSPAFRSMDYIIGVLLRNIIEIGMMAFPVTLIIITGGIDLSVGSTLVFSVMVGGLVADSHGPVLGTLAALTVGILCGCFNGFLIAKMKINPLVTTLSTMYLYMGLARSISKGDSVYSWTTSGFLGSTYLFKTTGFEGIPLQLVIYILLAVIFVILLNQTTLGRKLFAMGLNEDAAKFSGINTYRVKMQIYIMSGFICALAGLIWIGRFTSVKYDAGTSLNLKVVTVIVLGGTSILGGIGNMTGTIIATMIIATLNSGLTVMNIPIDVQIIVNGVVLVISLLCYAVLNKRMREKRIIQIELDSPTEKALT